MTEEKGASPPHATHAPAPSKPAKAPKAPRAKVAKPAKTGPAMEPAPPMRDANTCTVRVTKFGHGKVFTGETPVIRRPQYDEGEHWFPTFSAGDMVRLPRPIAERQEAMGHVEIQD